MFEGLLSSLDRSCCDVACKGGLDAYVATALAAFAVTCGEKFNGGAARSCAYEERPGGHMRKCRLQHWPASSGRPGSKGQGQEATRSGMSESPADQPGVPTPPTLCFRFWQEPKRAFKNEGFRGGLGNHLLRTPQPPFLLSPAPLAAAPSPSSGLPPTGHRRKAGLRP